MQKQNMKQDKVYHSDNGHSTGEIQFQFQFQFQIFIIYVPSQQPQGQLQTQRSVDASNYIMGEHNLKSKSNER
jgi:hypothetical protein